MTYQLGTDDLILRSQWTTTGILFLTIMLCTVAIIYTLYGLNTTRTKQLNRIEEMQARYVASFEVAAELMEEK